MILERTVKPTLTPFGLNAGDTLRLTLSDGTHWEMTLRETAAETLATDYAAYDYRDDGHESGDISAYGFSCVVSVNGRDAELRREVGTQASFYEPWVLDGVRIWFDAAACAFRRAGGFMFEKDIRAGCVCQPTQDARFAVQEETLAICPEPVLPWYPGADAQPDIRKCYNGEDCWMGPYGGAAAHCGLDVNMPAGTMLSAPINLDDHHLYRTVAAGFGNNSWRGVRRWHDGSEWRVQTAHLIEMVESERAPLKAGTPYATGAGTSVGAHTHTHFSFAVTEQGGEYRLDPWILLSAGCPAKTD